MSDDELLKRLETCPIGASCDVGICPCTTSKKAAARIREQRDLLDECKQALLEAKSEMRDWGPDHPAMKQIDATLTKLRAAQS